MACLFVLIPEKNETMIKDHYPAEIEDYHCPTRKIYRKIIVSQHSVINGIVSFSEAK